MSRITDRITEYLCSGGFFNPELMDPKEVSELLIECREEIMKFEKSLKRMVDWAGPVAGDTVDMVQRDEEIAATEEAQRLLGDDT